MPAPYLLVAPLLLLAGAASGAETEVLFLGNSYTAFNDLPNLVGGLAAAGGHATTTDRNTPGGNTLGAPQSSGNPHMSHPTSLAKIAGNDWEVVVLQDQSVLPTIPSSRIAYMFPGAQSLDASIAASDPNTRVMLYQTWGRRDGGTVCWGGCRTFDDFGDMQDALTSAYDDCAALIGAEVAPVGEAWRRAFELDPSLVLHTGDGSHPNLAGSYLAACVFYAKIFDESPVGLGFTAGLDTATASFLQHVADEVLFCSIAPTCAALPNSAGSGAALQAIGTARLSANDLVLLGSGMPPGATGIAITSPDVTLVPLGDGNLCVGSASLGFVVRFPSFTADFLGGVIYTFDNAQPPVPVAQVHPGETWHFQLWFRDNPAGMSGFNFSSGLAVTFCH